ncbi:LAMI_0G10154g1_1 [Lachancea mirantina]|uniref:LAMI_0G10154g1_1 n=1 Tax=Lachancea mirantina TaxID=1230905 RepID=A0A1G4KAI9_9SACH|nr:LAMI_0G10154g1_1 [Lachancea mirantina]
MKIGREMRWTRYSIYSDSMFSVTQSRPLLFVREWSLYSRRFYRTSKPNILVKTSNNAPRKRHPAKDKRSSLNPTPFQYGTYGGLIENEDKIVEQTSALLKKVATFHQLKILPDVRTAAQSVLSQESILNNRNYIASNRKEVRIKKEHSGLDADSINPSPIQVATIQKLAKTLMDIKLQVHTIAAETGSGKTMAYLIPLFDYLKRFEVENAAEWESLKDKAVIRSAILVPTHELADQVYNTVNTMAEALDLNACKYGSGSTYSGFLDSVKARVDILVTTPGKMLNLFNVRIIERPERLFARTSFVVLDEADTLMDKSWLEETYKTIQMMPNAYHLLLCSATIPNEFRKTVQRLFPTSHSISTPKLHRLPNNIDFKLIDATLNPYKGSKMKALAQTLYAITMDGTELGFQKRAIIFVNEKKDVANIVEKLVNDFGHDCVGLTGEDSAEVRAEKIKPFVSPPQPLKSATTDLRDQAAEQISTTSYTVPGSNVIISNSFHSNGEVRATLKVLVTSDVTARGINFQGVRNIILYDVPKTAVDLVHRVGRTGRMNQSGRVFMLTDKKTKSWAKGLPKVARNHIPIA